MGSHVCCVSKVTQRPKSAGKDKCSSPTPSFKRLQELIQDLKENPMNNTLEFLRRLLASAIELERTIIASLKALEEHGEGLRAIELTVTRIIEYTTQLTLNGLSTEISNLLTLTEKPKKPLSKGMAKPEEPRAKVVTGFSACDIGPNNGAGAQESDSVGLGQQQQKHVTSFAEYDRQYKENLGMFADCVARLINLAKNPSHATSLQNDQLENILPCMQTAQENIANKVRKIKSLE